MSFPQAYVVFGAIWQMLDGEHVNIIPAKHQLYFHFKLIL